MANHARVDLVDQLIPSRLVDREDRDAVHAHLLSVGWEADGTQYRWRGAGKRTWTRALAEQVGREVEEAAETIAVCDDPELVAAAAAEPELRLRVAALSSRFVTEAMVRAAVNDGLHVEAAGAAVVPDDVVGLLVDVALEERYSSQVAEALVANRAVPLRSRVAVVEERSLERVRQAALGGNDPELLGLLARRYLEVLAKVPARDVTDHRKLVEALAIAATNPVCPVLLLEDMAELRIYELSIALCRNPLLPAGIYRRLAPTLAVRRVAEERGEAVAAIPVPYVHEADDPRAWTRRLWMVGRHWEAQPGATLSVAQLHDGDLVAMAHIDWALEERIVSATVGPWVEVHLERPVDWIEYQAFGRGAIPWQSRQWYASAGADLLLGWDDVVEAFEAVDGTAGVRNALMRERAAIDDAWTQAAVACAAGVEDRTVAKLLEVRVGEFRDRVGDPPDRYRRWRPDGDVVPDVAVGEAFGRTVVKVAPV